MASQYLRILPIAASCWLGGGHCSWDCCFDAAGQRWVCAERARLGLPRHAARPRASGDYDNPDGLVVEPCASCSKDGTGHDQSLTISCDISTEGEIGASFTFTASGCQLDYFPCS